MSYLVLDDKRKIGGWQLMKDGRQRIEGDGRR
jgi:hypothetical protein